MTEVKYSPKALPQAKEPADVIGHFQNLMEFRRTTVKPISDVIKEFEKVKQGALDLCDQYKRPGVLAKLSKDAVLKAVSALVGPVSEHPYIKFHAQHFEALITLARAFAAASRAQQNLQKAYEIAASVAKNSGAALAPYRESGDRFRKFKESMNPVYLGAWLLRGYAREDLENPRTSKATLKDVLYITFAVYKVHAEARNQTKQLFEIYAGLYQSLGAVISLRLEADRDFEKMKSEKGTFRGLAKNMATIAQSAADIRMLQTNMSDDKMTDETLSTDTLTEPIQAAIRDTEAVISAWAEADQKFTDDLYRQDVAASRPLGR